MTLNARDVYGLEDGQIIWAEVLSNIARSISGYYIYSDTVADNNYLRVVENGTPSMDVDINAGKINNKTSGAGVTGTIAAATHAITAAHATLGRYDLVMIVIGATPTIDVIDGTPAAVPVAPTTMAANNYPLALVYVGPGVTTITNANITDLRVLKYSASP